MIKKNIKCDDTCRKLMRIEPRKKKAPTTNGAIGFVSRDVVLNIKKSMLVGIPKS